MTRWLGRVLGDLADDLQRLPGPAIVHGDLWYENMLVRGSRLTAVVDWEAAAIEDPAVDLAGLWYLGDDWARAVLDARSDRLCRNADGVQPGASCASSRAPPGRRATTMTRNWANQQRSSSPFGTTSVHTATRR